MCMKVANLNNMPDGSNSYYAIAAGGSTGQNTISGTSDVYNSTSQSWSPGPEMNVPRTRFQLTSIYNNTNAVIATGGLQVRVHAHSFSVPRASESAIALAQGLLAGPCVALVGCC